MPALCDAPAKGFIATVCAQDISTMAGGYKILALEPRAALDGIGCVVVVLLRVLATSVRAMALSFKYTVFRRMGPTRTDFSASQGNAGKCYCLAHFEVVLLHKSFSRRRAWWRVLVRKKLWSRRSVGRNCCRAKTRVWLQGFDDRFFRHQPWPRCQACCFGFRLFKVLVM